MSSKPLSFYEAAYARTLTTTPFDTLLEAATTTSIPKANARESAVHRVFNTTELFELILLALPMQDLLFSQSISRCFRETVQGSLALKQKLFLAPLTINGQTLRLNPLLTCLGEFAGPDSRIYDYLHPEDVTRLQIKKGKHLSFPFGGKCYTASARPVSHANPMPFRTQDTKVHSLDWDVRELCMRHDPDADPDRPNFQPWQRERLHPESSAWDMLLCHGEVRLRLAIWRCTRPSCGHRRFTYTREQYTIKDNTMRELFEEMPLA